MGRLIFGVFMLLHGLVHLLYAGQSGRLFELQPNMAWPDGAWAFARLLGNETTRLLGSIAFILAAVGFAAGGIGILVKQAWWHPVVVATAVYSSVIFILFWDCKVQKLHDKGAVGILINLLILAALLIWHWPHFDF